MIGLFRMSSKKKKQVGKFTGNIKLSRIVTDVNCVIQMNDTIGTTQSQVDTQCGCVTHLGSDYRIFDSSVSKKHNLMGHSRKINGKR